MGRGARQDPPTTWLDELPAAVLEDLDRSELLVELDPAAEARRLRLATELQAVVAAYAVGTLAAAGDAHLCRRLRAKRLSGHEGDRLRAAEREAGVVFVAYERSSCTT